VDVGFGPRHQHATSSGAGLLSDGSKLRSAKGLLEAILSKGVTGRAPTITGNDARSVLKIGAVGGWAAGVARSGGLPLP